MRKMTIDTLKDIAARYPSREALDIDLSPAEAVEMLDALRAAGYTDIPVQADARQMRFDPEVVIDVSPGAAGIASLTRVSYPPVSPRADVCRCMHGHAIGGDCPECP